MNDADHALTEETALDRRADDREADLREAGQFPYGPPVPTARDLDFRDRMLANAADRLHAMARALDADSKPLRLVLHSDSELLDVSSFGERAAPTVAALPLAELVLAAAERAVLALRQHAAAPSLRHLSDAHGAATLLGSLIARLERAAGVALHERASRFPRECLACGAVHTREGWATLVLAGIQRDPTGDLELRHCPCGSTLAMPRVA